MAKQILDQSPLVSLILPVRNEAEHLGRALDAIDAQGYPSDRIEIIVVDGGSTDGTLDLIHRRSALDGRLSLLGGPGMNTPMAMCIGMEAANGDVIVKVDGHGWMNDQFVEVAVDNIASDAGLGCVGGLIEPIAATPVERANAYARFSRFGVGGGVYTLADSGQDTETVQCGAYRRDALHQVGGFDPQMAYGEDEELNYRIRMAGWHIRLDPAMRFTYHVRPSVASLFRQYLRYGRARVAVVRKHPAFFRAKHAVPAMMVAGLVATPLIGAVSGSRVLPVIIWGGYLGFLGIGAGWLSLRRRFWRPDLLMASLAAIHFGYGIGFLRGLLDSPGSEQSRPQRVEGASGPRAKGDRVPEQPQPEHKQR